MLREMCQDRVDEIAKADEFLIALYVSAAEEAANQDAIEVSRLAKSISGEFAEDVEVSPALLAAAVDAIRRMVELRPDDADRLAPLAHLLARQGNLDEAIATQRRAVEFATEDQRSIVAAFLSELEAKAEAAKLPSAAKADDPATKPAAPADEETILEGGPVGQPTDAATESPVEAAASAP